MEFFAPKFALVAVKEIPFQNRVRLSVLPRESDSAAHVMGIRFTKPDGGTVLLYGALATSLKSFMVLRVEDDRAQELLPPTAGATGNRMSMEFSRGRVTFQVGDRTVWSGAEGGFTDVIAVIGSLALPKGAGAAASVKDVSLLGEVNPVWMTKKTAGLRDAVASELAKEFRARKGGAAAGPSLSVDAALPEIPPVIRDFYRSALAKLAAVRRSRLQEDLDAACSAMEEMTRVDPVFPPAWYFLGEAEELGGNRRAAADAYARALALLPEFPEALCGRGRLRATAGAWTEARDAAEKALSLKPDLPDGHLLRARILWEGRDVTAVLEATELARALAPSDPDLQASAQQLANVARGPRWARANSYESAHYSVRSDLAAARCREYAEHLEALRPHYEEVLGRLLPAGRRAEVLIFESEEGYFGYNDFTIGTRQEHTLGAFSPWTGQMALFEGTDVQETCRVLSHEGFHQALHAIATDVPIWLNEGMAEYVGAARVERGKVVERGGVQAGRLENLALAVKYGWQPLAFEAILRQSQAEFYASEAPLKYAQAWSMVRYFMDGDGGRWRPLMRDYIARVLAGDSERSAFEATFAKQDLRLAEAGWLKHYGLVLRPKPAAPWAGGPAAAPPAPPTDLMALLASAAPGPATGWSLSEGTLECSRFASASLVLDYEPPGEYDWRLTVRRTGGEGPLLLGLQGGGKTFVLRLDDRAASRIDGTDGTPARSRPVLPVGRSVLLVCSVRKTGVSVVADRETVFQWKGDVGMLAYVPGEGMPEATRNLFLSAKDVGFQIGAMAVAGLGAAADPNSAGPAAASIVPADPARSIPVDAELRRWVADEDGRQLLALDAAGTLELISLAERKVVRRISVGTGASCVYVAPGGFRTAWVGFHPGGNLVRVDLERGEVAETVPTAYEADGLVVIRRIAYLAVPNGPLAAVDLAEKKDLGNLGLNGCAALAYEARKDRLWSLSLGGLTEFDGSKCGPALKELGRKNLTPKERSDLNSLVNSMGKAHSIGGQDPGQLGPRMMLDERSGRLYVSSVAVRTDRPEATVGVFRAPAHSLDRLPAVREFASKILGRDQILAASPDGKWAASGSHLYNAATFALVKELPLPTSLVAFSRDSKEIYYYDWATRAIVATDVEPR